jgi:hypothetical protein
MTHPKLTWYWRAFHYWSEERTPITYDERRSLWKCESGISIPWAVTDDYGDLMAVDGPNTCWDGLL